VGRDFQLSKKVARSGEVRSRHLYTSVTSSQLTGRAISGHRVSGVGGPKVGSQRVRDREEAGPRDRHLGTSGFGFREIDSRSARSEGVTSPDKRGRSQR
jgi:hypothetical protein